MRDCVLLVDVFDDFRHRDGRALLASFESRHRGLHDLVGAARTAQIPIVYANDSKGIFDGDAAGIVERARSGPVGALLGPLTPVDGDRFVVKPRYSAFDSTPLELILRELEIERVLLAGMSTEGCVAQTAIAAREAGLKVTVVTGACATIDDDVERIALAYLDRVAGVQLAGTADEVVGRGPDPAGHAAHGQGATGRKR